jgi:hypothetical protein
MTPSSSLSYSFPSISLYVCPSPFPSTQTTSGLLATPAHQQHCHARPINPIHQDGDVLPSSPLKRKAKLSDSHGKSPDDKPKKKKKISVQDYLNRRQPKPVASDGSAAAPASDGGAAEAAGTTATGGSATTTAPFTTAAPSSVSSIVSNTPSSGDAAQAFDAGHPPPPSGQS